MGVSVGNRRSATLWIAIIGVAVLAGCGSTVPVNGSAASTGDGSALNGLDSSRGTGISGGTGTVSGGTGHQSNATPGNRPRGNDAASSGATSTGSDSTGSSTPGGASQAPAVAAPGVTASAIYVGATYRVNGEAANNAVGAKGITYGDQKAEQQALIDDINRRGGVAGRRLVPVWHKLDSYSSKPASEQEAEMCADFTQDHHVLVVMYGGSAGFLRCVTRSGATVLSDDVGDTASAADFRTYRRFFEVGSLNLDRLAKTWVPSLQRQNWLTPWDTATGVATTGVAKVGIISPDYPTYNAMVRNVLIPKLALAGATNPEWTRVSVPDSQAGAGPSSAQISSALLRFRQKGVDHVLPVDASGLLTLLTLNQAESQRYFPRYGITTPNGVQALLESQAVPVDQLRGMVGIGWAPVLDTAAPDNAPNGRYSNDARRSCLALMAAHGLTLSSSVAQSVALSYCSRYRLLVQALLPLKAITADSLVAAVERIGGSYLSPDVPALRFDPSRHDGVAGVYDLYYETQCSCMRYRGPVRATP